MEGRDMVFANVEFALSISVRYAVRKRGFPSNTMRFWDVDAPVEQVVRFSHGRFIFPEWPVLPKTS